jgi:hypothetical protein
MVRWHGKTQTGETPAWAGDGLASVVTYNERQPGFGGKKEPAGPAVLLKFQNGQTAWVDPEELEDLGEE